MKAGALRIRTPALQALLGLAASGILLGLAYGLGLWQASFIVVPLAAWAVGRDVVKEGYFHPVFLFGAFVLSMTLVGFVWMAVFMDEALAFGAYSLQVRPEDLFVLSSEQLLLFLGVYAGYLMVGGIGARHAAPTTVERVAFDSLWYVFYGLGVLALLYLILGTGGFAELLGSLGEKYERAAGNGPVILLTYFAYVGALLWYVRNVTRPAWQRYGGLILLLLPMLLTGSRTEMLVCLLAAGYLDERAGRRPNLAILTLAGALLVGFFAVYQMVRGQVSYGVFTAVAKDLSMGVGYVIAVREEIVGDEYRLGTLWLTVSPLLPGPVEALVGVPESPNYVFTQTRVPGAPSTQSMGVMGEANYVLRYGWSLFYYFVVGALLAWAGSAGWKRSALLAAIVAGCTFRIAKGGLTAGVANLLLLLAPLLFAYLLVRLFNRLPAERKEAHAARY